MTWFLIMLYLFSMTNLIPYLMDFEFCLVILITSCVPNTEWREWDSAFHCLSIDVTLIIIVVHSHHYISRKNVQQLTQKISFKILLTNLKTKKLIGFEMYNHEASILKHENLRPFFFNFTTCRKYIKIGKSSKLSSQKSIY